MNTSRVTIFLSAVILLRGGFVSSSTLASEPSAASPVSDQPVTLAHAGLPASSRPAPVAKRNLAESELKELLTAALQAEHVRDLGDLELTFTRPWKTVLVPDQPLTIRIVELPTVGVSPMFIVRFELRAGDEWAGAWQQPVRARIWRDLWVARAKLERGAVLADADRVLERRDVLAVRDAYLDDNAADAAMLELAQSVPAGIPLTNQMIRPRTIVRRGQVAEAVVRDGPMEISLKVEILEDGAKGQQVRVRNPQSKREFRGKVENENTITIGM
jgi:flagella basal body P-ring formation protein FlgA